MDDRSWTTEDGANVVILGLVLAVLAFVFQSPVLYALAAAAIAVGLWSRARRPGHR